jgi:hypothetical protein
VPVSRKPGTQQSSAMQPLRANSHHPRGAVASPNVRRAYSEAASSCLDQFRRPRLGEIRHAARQAPSVRVHEVTASAGSPWVL